MEEFIQVQLRKLLEKQRMKFQLKLKRMVKFLQKKQDGLELILD